MHGFKDKTEQSDRLTLNEIIIINTKTHYNYLTIKMKILKWQDIRLNFNIDLSSMSKDEICYFYNLNSIDDFINWFATFSINWLEW